MTNTMNWGQLLADAGGGFEPLPDGPYDVLIDTASATTTKNGKPMYKVKFKVLNGPYANRTVYNNFVVSAESQNAMKFFFAHMNVLGLGSEFFAANPSDELIVANLLGKQCRIDVGHRQYNGQMQNEVNGIQPSAGMIQNAIGVAPGGVPVPPTQVVQQATMAPVIPPPPAPAPPVPQPAAAPPAPPAPTPPAPAAAPGATAPPVPF